LWLHNLMAGGKRRHRIAGILLLMLAAYPLLLLIRDGGKSTLARQLQDGTFVTIRKVSYGKNHTYVTGNFLKKFAGKILPEKYRARFGVNAIAFTTTANSTAIFIETVITNGEHLPLTDARSLVGKRSFVLMTDDAGNQFFLQPGPSFASTNMLVESFTSLVSHQSRHFQLQVSHRDVFTVNTGNAPVTVSLPTENEHVDFTLPNPAPRALPRWTAPVLPQTNSLDGFQIVLLELQSRSNQSWTSARVQILQNGTPSKDFKLSGVRVLDEEGNDYVPTFSLYPKSDNSDTTILFEGAFSSKETRKFGFKISPAANIRAPGRYIEFLARPSLIATNPFSSAK
jgi:hypothetical protein